jgi:malonyl CoA-acyl carrier protein transacylase
VTSARDEVVPVFLSAFSRNALVERIDQLLRSTGSPLKLMTCTATPSGARERLALLAPASGLRSALRLARDKIAAAQGSRLIVRSAGVYYGSGLRPGKLAFLFPGEGAQHIGMLDESRSRLGPVAAWLNSLDACYARNRQPPPSAEILPKADPDPAKRKELERQLFDISRGGQLSTVTNLALCQVLADVGLRPDVVLGHSNGEHAAAMIACMDPDADRDHICDWLRRTSLAGRRLGEPPAPEVMFAVGGVKRRDLEAAIAVAGLGVFIAMDNCPNQQVIGGLESSVNAAVAEIARHGGICRRLPFGRAYHTPLFADWAAVLRGHYHELALRRPRIPLISCLTASPVAGTPDAVRDALSRQWTAQVRLREAVEYLYDSGVRTFVEVGADDSLSAFVQDTLRNRAHLAAPIHSAKQGELASFRRLLALLHIHGVELDQECVYAALGVGASVSPQLRVTPSQSADAPPGRDSLAARARPQSEQVVQQRALVDAARVALARQSPVRLTGPRIVGPRLAPPGLFLDHRAKSSRIGLRADELAFRLKFSRSGDPMVADHCLGRSPAHSLPVLSFTTSLSMAVEAARRAFPCEEPAVATDVRATDWLALDNGELEVLVTARRDRDAVSVELCRPSSDPAFSARVKFFPSRPERLPRWAATDIATGRPPTGWTVERFYREFAFHGPSFQTVNRVETVSADRVSAQLTVTSLPTANRPHLDGDPALLDATGQLVAFWLLDWCGLQPTFGVFPYSADRVLLKPTATAGSRVECHGVVRRVADVATEASFLLTADGRVIALVEGLRQRVVHLPPEIANWVLGPGTAQISTSSAVTGERRLDLGHWRPVLTGSGAIWARALAHQVLDAHDLAVWESIRSVDWLLRQILARETAQSRARAEGLQGVPLRAIRVEDGLATIPGNPPRTFDTPVWSEGGNLRCRARERARA